METINLDSWDTFLKSLSLFFAQWSEIKKERHPQYIPTPLFRGQSNACWKLQTTLERYTNLQFADRDYYETVSRVKPAVVSITEKGWDLPPFMDGGMNITPTGYEFMVYLRHHGFPSPLLDWTRSPYVAAFFAFRSPQVPEHERVAIYSYVAYREAYRRGSPIVLRSGPYVESHKRHYAQQCEYTICVTEVENKRLYCSHEAAFTGEASDQGELKKYTLPASERRKALKQLQRMNVTAFSLFGSEESLMETLAYQEIDSP